MMLGKLIESERFAGVGQLANNVAQQLNNPLTVILGYSALLEDSPTVSGERRGAEAIGRAARPSMGSDELKATGVASASSDEQHDLVLRRRGDRRPAPRIDENIDLQADAEFGQIDSRLDGESQPRQDQPGVFRLQIVDIDAEPVETFPGPQTMAGAVQEILAISGGGDVAAGDLVDLPALESCAPRPAGRARGSRARRRARRPGRASPPGRPPHARRPPPRRRAHRPRRGSMPGSRRSRRRPGSPPPHG